MSIFRWEAPPYPLDYLLTVLKLSSQWDLPSGWCWALYHLQQMQHGIRPAFQLRLAHLHKIHEWIRPALAHLARTPLKSLTEEDCQLLGYKTVYFIARVREGLDNLRKTLAVIPPDIENKQSARCSPEQHVVCMQVWTDAWLKKITCKLVHPHPLGRNEYV